MKKIAIAMGELEFIKKGRIFHHRDCPFYIEFVTPPVAIGDEPIKNYEFYKTQLGTIKMFTPTDSVRDRLASYYHWNDEQGFAQAISICRELPQKIDFEKI